MTVVAQWECPTLDPSQLNQDPVQAEFFTDELVGHNLVREALQNALDERRPGSTAPVEVRFTIRSGDRALPAERAARYLAGLDRHLELCQTMYPDEIDQEQIDMAAGKVAMPYVLIEDFKTMGLCGDVTQIGDVQAGAGDRNNFYWFFRNDGRSGKRAEDAGSWGVGKTVFQELSQVNANFALTVRYDDQQRLLMGKTLLKTHQETRNGQLNRYAAYGYWAGPRGPREPYMPIEDTGVSDRFVSDFEVTRKSESGLSIIVPFPHESVTGDALIRGVLVSYFRPIVTQRLVVVVDDNGIERRLADADDLRRAVETIEMEGTEREQLGQLLNTAEDLETLPASETIRLSDPLISASTIPPEVVTRMRERFDSVRLLRVHVPQVVKKREQEPVTDGFDVVLKKDPGGRNRRPYYVRDQLSLSENGPRSSHPTSALVVVEQGPLAELLRSSENPSHSAWQSSKRERFRMWPNGADVVRHVNRSVNDLLHVLFGESNQKRPDALINFFFEERARQRRATKRRRKRSDGPPAPALVPFYKYEALTTGGLRVYGNQEADTELRPIRFRLAYDREDGNALQKHSPLDFDLASDIDITNVGATIKIERANELLIEPDRRDFEVQLNGFGVRRDLFVQARSL